LRLSSRARTENPAFRSRVQRTISASRFRRNDLTSQGLLNGVPTLVVTAQTMTPQQVQEAGFDAYLRKPVDPTVLCETVRTLARRGTQLSA
jgi:CheY-like chemotaxis protein